VNKQPNLFVVGAPKAGTSALCAHLGQHPEIFLHPRKETHVFATDLVNGAQEERFKKSPSEAFASFHEREERFCCDGSTWHLFSRVAAANIKQHNPESRIIAAIRNPVDLVSSLYSFRIATGQWPDKPFEYFWRRETDSLSSEPIVTRNVCTEVARYAPQLRRYFKEFGRQNVTVLICDDIYHDEHSELAAIFRGLGLEPANVDLSRHNVTHSIRSQTFQKFISWRPPILTPLLYMAPRPIRRGAYRSIARLNSRPGRQGLPPRLRAKLLEHFIDDIREVESLLSRDLSAWKVAN
jgi:hypothetical protein